MSLEMDQKESQDFEISDIANKFFLLSTKESTRYITTYIQNGELKLEFEYSIEKQKFLNLDGSIGQLINKAPFSEELKLQRCQEVIRHAIIEYEFSIKKNNNKLKIG